MDRPLLSICIPTYNRSNFLNFCLKKLKREFADFDTLIEIIVSDNCSSDNTEKVCLDALEIFGERFRYYRQEVNIGAVKNLQFIFSKAQGLYSVYLADDDVLFWNPLFEALETLLENESAIALFAPWCFIDLLENSIEGQFYSHSETRLFQSSDRRELVYFILQNKIFSEISIVKTDAIKKIIPLISDISFWGFSNPAEYLSFGKVIYSPKVFYGSVTRHPSAPSRLQEGIQETIFGWDKYRGGVEYLISTIYDELTHDQLVHFQSLADSLVDDRMLVALKLRLAQGLNPVDSYFLASRLRGRGQEAFLPMSIAEIRSRAAIYFLTTTVSDIYKAEELIIYGNINKSELDFVSMFSQLPVQKYQENLTLGTRYIMLIWNGSASIEDMLVKNASYVVDGPTLLKKFQ